MTVILICGNEWHSKTGCVHSHYFPGRHPRANEDLPKRVTHLERTQLLPREGSQRADEGSLFRGSDGYFLMVLSHVLTLIKYS
ncbi:hypothetical protein BCU70_14085 [Vibrio sp. 10N.286.49.C2]|nr:hypothetical protein BCU70_14085 [Vibrio sp. 10N.286.49.C2]